MRSAGPVRAALVAAVLFGAAAAAAGADWDFARAPDPDGLDAFVAAHPRAGLLVLREWTGLDIDTDAMRRADLGGVRGREYSLIDYLVRSEARLEDAAEVWTVDLPLMKLKEVRVTVTRQGRTRTLRRGDLAWARATPVAGGVVYLDGTASVGVIPDLRVGDRVRVVQEHELDGAFGLGTHGLGSSDEPCFQAGLEIRTSGSGDLVAGLWGTAQARDRLRAETRSDGGRNVATWVLQGDADGTLPVCGDAYPTVRVTPHLRAVARLDRPDVAVGADWASVGRAYLARIDGVFAADEQLAAEARDLVAGATTDHERIDRIYRHVQATCHYLGLYSGMGGMIPVPATAVRDQGSGDCKGLAVLIIAMLRAVGVDAHPVLLGTRGGGRVDPEIPDLSQFDHFIAWADDGQGGVFLDGTVDFFPAGRVPDGDRAWPVLQLGPGEPRMVTIPAEASPPGRSVAEVSGTLALDDNGAAGLELAVACSASDNLGTRWRNILAGLSPAEREREVLDFLLPDEPPLVGSDVQVLGLDAWSEPLVLKATARTRVPLPSTPDRVFLPRSLADLAVPEPPLPACGDSLDLGRMPHREFHWRLTLPDGFRLAAADSARYETEGLVIEESVAQEGPQLVGVRRDSYTPTLVDRAAAEAIRDLLGRVAAARRAYLELRR